MARRLGESRRPNSEFGAQRETARLDSYELCKRGTVARMLYNTVVVVFIGASWMCAGVVVRTNFTCSERDGGKRVTAPVI